VGQACRKSRNGCQIIRSRRRRPVDAQEAAGVPDVGYELRIAARNGTDRQRAQGPSSDTTRGTGVALNQSSTSQSHKGAS
jgi:hypothetical protein